MKCGLWSFKLRHAKQPFLKGNTRITISLHFFFYKKTHATYFFLEMMDLIMGGGVNECHIVKLPPRKVWKRGRGEVTVIEKSSWMDERRRRRRRRQLQVVTWYFEPQIFFLLLLLFSFSRESLKEEEAIFRLSFVAERGQIWEIIVNFFFSVRVQLHFQFVKMEIF